MAITEEQRYQLFQRLEQVLGPQEATTLMEHLPPVGWTDVATKADLAHQRALTQADLRELRTELKGDINDLRTELKGDINDLRTELKGDINDLRTELKGDINDLCGQVTELRGEMGMLRLELDAKLERGFREQTRTMVLANLGTMVGFGSLLLAAVKL